MGGALRKERAYSSAHMRPSLSGAATWITDIDPYRRGYLLSDTAASLVQRRAYLDNHPRARDAPVSYLSAPAVTLLMSLFWNSKKTARRGSVARTQPAMIVP